MPVTLIVNGTSYEYPVPGEDPTWANDATDWAKAVTSVLATLVAPGDILQTQFTLNNNILVPTNINGLIFDSGTVRAANVDYTIYRISDTNTSGQTESGRIYLTYDDSALVGNKWVISQVSNGTNSGVVFNIDEPTGQIQYISSDIGNLGYSGLITFSAKVLNK
jgi:hypothetical protein